MSMQDPIADMLTRIRNAHARILQNVSMPSSKLKVAIVKILLAEGYVTGFDVVEENGRSTLIITLKYFSGKPVIESINRISKPSLRCYRSVNDLPKVLGGFGTVIVSTSKGIMTDKVAREQGIGGEILCTVA